MIISIVNEKGGSGKTTIAVNLAAMLSAHGDNVVLLDADPQQSTAVFSNARSLSDKEPLFVNVGKTGVALNNEIKNLKDKFDSIVVDTGGRDSIEMRKAMLVSNIIIIPTIPSQYDVSVLDVMLDRYAEAKINNENLIAGVLMNRINPNPFMTQELISLKEYLQEAKEKKGLSDLYLFETAIYERQAYRKATVDGLSIQEFCKADDKALSDFVSFYNELIEMAKSKLSN